MNDAEREMAELYELDHGRKWLVQEDDGHLQQYTRAYVGGGGRAPSLAELYGQNEEDAGDNPWNVQPIDESESGGGTGSNKPAEERLRALQSSIAELYSASGEEVLDVLERKVAALRVTPTPDGRLVSNPPKNGVVTENGILGVGRKAAALAYMLNADGHGDRRAQNLWQTLQPGQRPPKVEHVRGDLYRVEGVPGLVPASAIDWPEVDMGVSERDVGFAILAERIARQVDKQEVEQRKEERQQAIAAVDGDFEEAL